MADRRLTSWLPAGTSMVAIGLVLNGAATYVFLGLPARSNRLTPDQYGIFSTLWFAVFLIGPGLFIPLEQELGRRVAKAKAAGRSSAQDEKTTFVIASVASFVVALGLLLAAGPIADHFFAGSQFIVAALACAISAHGLTQWVKGLLAGKGEFRGYGLLVGAEGLFRLGLLIVIVLFSPTTVPPYTIPVALSPFIAVLFLSGAVSPGFWRQSLGDIKTIATSLGVLSGAQLAAQFLMNGVPLAVAALVDDSDRHAVGRIGAALVLARVPLFLFQAIQASLLPGLAALAEIGDYVGFRRRVRSVSIGLASIGAVAVVGGALLGPLATRLLFGPEFEASRFEFASLVLSAIMIVLGLVSAQSLIALDQHRTAAIGWVTGVVAFLVVLPLPGDLITRVLWAGIVGPCAAFVVMALLLMRAANQVSLAPSGGGGGGGSITI